MIKHYKFTAAECIGWIRICRPGSIIGPQQHFLEDKTRALHMQGNAYRAKVKRLSKSSKKENKETGNQCDVEIQNGGPECDDYRNKDVPSQRTTSTKDESAPSQGDELRRIKAYRAHATRGLGTRELGTSMTRSDSFTLPTTYITANRSSGNTMLTRSQTFKDTTASSRSYELDPYEGLPTIYPSYTPLTSNLTRQYSSGSLPRTIRSSPSHHALRARTAVRLGSLKTRSYSSDRLTGRMSNI